MESSSRQTIGDLLFLVRRFGAPATVAS